MMYFAPAATASSSQKQTPVAMEVVVQNVVRVMDASDLKADRSKRRRRVILPRESKEKKGQNNFAATGSMS